MLMIRSRCHHCARCQYATTSTRCWSTSTYKSYEFEIEIDFILLLLIMIKWSIPLHCVMRASLALRPHTSSSSISSPVSSNNNNVSSNAATTYGWSTPFRISPRHLVPGFGERELLISYYFLFVFSFHIFLLNNSDGGCWVCSCDIECSDCRTEFECHVISIDCAVDFIVFLCCLSSIVRQLRFYLSV